MKKKAFGKLRLSRETVVQLCDPLKRVVGGGASALCTGLSCNTLCPQVCAKEE